MENRDWHIIQALHTEKNITKAAQLLYMSQPALTSRLQHIEREFNVQLVIRSTKGIQFTPEGEYLVKISDEMLGRLNNIKNEIRNLSNTTAGTIEIGASNYLTLYTLPKILQQFKELYPHADFKVATDWSKDIFGLVANNKVHVGFVSIDYGGCKDIHLLYEEPICVASTTPFELKDLPHMPCIDFKSDYLLKMQKDKWWREHFTEPPLISMHVDKLANCKEMVRYGLGYAILPERITFDLPNLQKHYLTNSNGDKLMRKTWMIANSDALELPVVRLFVDFIKNLSF